MTDEAVVELGSDLEECHRLGERLPRSEWEHERYWMTQKWFDYRSLHPVQATYRYADAFRVAYRDTYRREIDHARGEFVRPIRHEDVFCDKALEDGTTTAIWRGRVAADMLGMPYDAYCQTAFKWAMRKNRKFLPRPTQLYGFNLLTAIKETWEELQEGRLYVAQSEIFANQRYQALPVQDAHHEWLMQQAAKRANPAPALSDLIYRREVLLESKVVARFGHDMIDRARSLA